MLIRAIVFSLFLVSVYFSILVYCYYLNLLLVCQSIFNMSFWKVNFSLRKPKLVRSPNSLVHFVLNVRSLCEIACGSFSSPKIQIATLKKFCRKNCPFLCVFPSRNHDTLPTVTIGKMLIRCRRSNVDYQRWYNVEKQLAQLSIQPRQSTVKYQRLYNVGCTTSPTFFRLWKKLFSDSKCTR